MVHIRVDDDEVDLRNSTLVEGFPGAGLVGKIVADHMVDAMDLGHYANVHCFDQVAVYDRGTPELASPVRLDADPSGEGVVLQSDIPVEADATEEFAECFAPWLENNTMPEFITGLPTTERSQPPELFGVGSGAGVETVDAAGLARPPECGVIRGRRARCSATPSRTGSTPSG